MRSQILFVFCVSLTALVFTNRAHVSAAPSSVELGNSATPYDVWLLIRNDGHCLYFEDGHIIRFEGRGEVVFGTDRREARLSGDVVAYVNGERVKGEIEVRYGDTVELRAGESRWVIQSVQAGGLPEGHGTRISDEHPSDTARIESEDDLVFFVQPTYEGGAHFFYPKMNS